MIALAPIQEKLKLNDPKLRRALVDLQAAANLAGEDNDESDILDDITRGPRDPHRIDWAWDIAGIPQEQTERTERDKKQISVTSVTSCSVRCKREIRVLALCVQNRAARFSFEDVLYTIFPEQRTKLFRKPTLSATFLARRLACTAPHILNLIADGCLTAVSVQGSTFNVQRSTPGARTGRNGSPAILWTSIRTFLESRRIV